MAEHVTTTFATRGWDEAAYADPQGGPRLTRAAVTKAWTGALEGDSTVEYLMCYAADGPTTFVGLEQVTGTLAGRTGGFVLRHDGAHDGTGVSGRVEVVPGSGTGQLAGISGEGRYDIAAEAEA